jgi:hypothetical protein
MARSVKELTRSPELKSLGGEKNVRRICALYKKLGEAQGGGWCFVFSNLSGAGAIWTCDGKSRACFFLDLTPGFALAPLRHT